MNIQKLGSWLWTGFAWTLAIVAMFFAMGLTRYFVANFNLVDLLFWVFGTLFLGIAVTIMYFIGVFLVSVICAIISGK